MWRLEGEGEGAVVERARERASPPHHAYLCRSRRACVCRISLFGHFIVCTYVCIWKLQDVCFLQNLEGEAQCVFVCVAARVLRLCKQWRRSEVLGNAVSPIFACFSQSTVFIEFLFYMDS